MRLGLRCATVALVAFTALVPLACGDDSSPPAPAADPPAVGGGGTLSYAIPAAPLRFDPLATESISAQTVLRQIYEPLVSSLEAPYGGRRGVPGPAISRRHSGDFRVWSLRLRPGIRFHDGGLLNASAVLANVERWRTSSTGRRLLPGLIAADGPRPDLMRFVFSAPLRDLPRRLSDPRLGLVSPTALRRFGAAGSSPADAAGSGPFRLGPAGPERLELIRFRGWWGSRRGLGPALDRIEFTVVPSRRARLARLREGAAPIAGDVGRAAVQRLRSDPLLTALGAGSRYAIGLERSVRGVRHARPAPLAGAWLAVLDQAG